MFSVVDILSSGHETVEKPEKILRAPLIVTLCRSGASFDPSALITLHCKDGNENLFLLQQFRGKNTIEFRNIRFPGAPYIGVKRVTLITACITVCVVLFVLN